MGSADAVGSVWRRTVRLLAGLSLAVGVLLSAAAGAREPAPDQASPRIVAVGDLHGDHEAWRAIARAAGLVDDRGRWTGGTATLVQLGDVADRGPDTLKIIRDLMRLQREAARSGGRVIALVGNHEAMNVTGDLRYVSEGEYAAFVDGQSKQRRTAVFEANRPAIEASYRQQSPKMTDAAIEAAWIAATPLGYVEHRRAWHPSGEIGKWVAQNPAVVLLQDTLFVHGGLGSAYAGRSLDDINRAVSAALAAGDVDDRSIIHDPLGPLWYRGLARRGAAAADAGESSAAPAPATPPLSVSYELTQVLAAFGAKRMVIGHTPNLAGILIEHEGRLARIDTGISAAYGGVLGWLEIVDGVMTPHQATRPAAPAGEGK